MGLIPQTWGRCLSRPADAKKRIKRARKRCNMSARNLPIHCEYVFVCFVPERIFLWLSPSLSHRNSDAL